MRHPKNRSKMKILRIVDYPEAGGISGIWGFFLIIQPAFWYNKGLTRTQRDENKTVKVANAGPLDWQSRGLSAVGIRSACQTRHRLLN